MLASLSRGSGLLGKATNATVARPRMKLDRLIAAFDAHPRQQIPFGRIVRFAVATAMRQEEVCRIEWADFDPEDKMLLVRDREDSRRKNGNNRRIPLLNVFGMTLVRTSTSNALVLERTPDEYSVTMGDQLAQRSVGSAKN